MDNSGIKKYKKESIYIVWEASKCVHCGNCARGLGDVFKPREKPWINPQNASLEAIVDQINKCPSGALTWIENLDQ